MCAMMNAWRRVRNVLEKDQYFCHHHRRPTFYEPFVTKLLVMQSTTRHQSKDMDKIRGGASFGGQGGAIVGK